MKPTEKYLHNMRAVWIRDAEEELSDADLDAMLDTTGPASDPAKRTLNPLTATGLVELLGAVIRRSNRRLEAVAEVFGLDMARLLETAEAAEHNGEIDRVTANMLALEREFSRRGTVDRRLTKWILTNAECLRRNMAGKGREQMIAELVEYFNGGNTAGKSNQQYAGMVRDYFDQEIEADDTECKLAACCVLFDLDRESVTERAAIIEFDGGESRTTAAIRAVWYALREKQPDISEMFAQSHFDYWDPEQGWNGVESLEWMAALLESEPKPATASIPRPPLKRVSA